MQTEQDLLKAKKYNKWVVVLSVLIPVVVAVLFGVKIPNVGPYTFLPPIYATINGITALILILAFLAIREKRIAQHKKLMTTAIILSTVFLVLYVIYHMTSESTSYGGDGTLKYIYFFILITHILLSIVVIPFVLITYLRAITNDIEKHKRIAKITFPLWLYVAITGVLVYVLISPYYA